MSLLEDLNRCLAPLGIPMETGVFSEPPPDAYLVITPLADSFGLHADNAPLFDVQEARISLFARGSYTKQKNAILRALLAAGVYISDRRYLGHEDDTGFFHYAIDVANYYTWQEPDGFPSGSD